MNDPARLFLGLELTDEARDALSAVRDALLAEPPPGAVPFAGKLHSPSLYHLTLAFLGMRPASDADCLREILDSVPCAHFPLTLSSLGTFKNGSILWSGVKESAPLMEYQSRLAAALRTGGFPFEEDIYRPHITLGRQVKSPIPDIAVPEVTFPVVHATLFESARVDGKLAYIPLYRSVFR